MSVASFNLSKMLCVALEQNDIAFKIIRLNQPKSIWSIFHLFSHLDPRGFIFSSEVVFFQDQESWKC